MEHDAAVAETHISTVFFAGERAYKLLKPIRTAFLDHATPEARGAACRRELELNRRLAPDVYLGVATIPEGDVTADHLLVMRRLPAERRLSSLLDTAEAAERVQAVARALAAFHAAQPPDERAGANARAASLRRLWEANLAELAELEGIERHTATLDRIATLAEEYVAGRQRLLDERVEAGLARDGHGDLLADDIFCLPDGPRILDCLAFDDDLRLGDVLLDAAFLAMDLERLGHAELARVFLDRYQELSGEHHPRSLADHYIAYRALVRAKVSAIRAAQGGQGAAADLERFLALCRAHLEQARPVLVLVGGAPGTGKSTVARGVGDALGWAVVSSDEVRKELAGIDHDEHAFAGDQQGIYTPEHTRAVYQELAWRAEALLVHGEPVILDASFTTADARAAARRAGTAARAAVVELRCVTDPAVARQRVEARLADGPTASDATPDVAERLAGRAEPWPEADDLDTTGPVAAVIEDAQARVRRSG